MAQLPETATWDDGVYQIETTDPVLGGPNGTSNAPLKNLANRTLYLKQQLGIVTPPGMVAHFARNTAPAGWLKANGAEVNRTTYAALFSAIGTTFGAGNGSTTFNLPDLRGEFIRGWDDGRGADPSRNFGSAQKGTLVGGYDDNRANGDIGVAEGSASTLGADPMNSNIAESYGLTRVIYSNSAGTVVYPLTEAGNWYAITRPRNIALLACIKY